MAKRSGTEVRRRAKQVGIAVLFSGDPETGKSSMDVFREDDDTVSNLDPYHRALSLRDVSAADFPSRLWSIAINERARLLMKNARMKAMGFPADDEDDPAPAPGDAAEVTHGD